MATSGGKNSAVGIGVAYVGEGETVGKAEGEGLGDLEVEGVGVTTGLFVGAAVGIGVGGGLGQGVGMGRAFPRGVTYSAAPHLFSL